MLLTSRWVCNKRMMPTADHNTPQRALSHRIVSGRPSECKKNQFCSILTSKTVLQSAPEDVIFIKKIEKFSGKGAQPRPLPQREGTPHPALTHLGASTRVLYKILDTPLCMLISSLIVVGLSHCMVCQTHAHIDHGTCDVCSNRPHLRDTYMICNGSRHMQRPLQ